MNKIDPRLLKYIHEIPKTELHIHVEGSLEPKQVIELAKRNGIDIPFKTEKSLIKAHDFGDLQSFLDLYYLSMSVLITEKDFYELTVNYLTKAIESNVVHIELFFDPQAHTERGIKIETIVNGIYNACEDFKTAHNLSYYLIPCFLRHLSEEDAFDMFNQLKPFYNKIKAFGLDSAEVGNPPEKFKNIYETVRKQKILRVAHAGEEGTPDNIWSAIKDLKINRIDHGNAAIQDKKLIKYLAEKQIPLTMCPLSNLSLKVIDNLFESPLKKLLDANVVVNINSDDPAYFGGYIEDNYIAITEALSLDHNDIKKLAINSFRASFLPKNTIDSWIQKIESIKY